MADEIAAALTWVSKWSSLKCKVMKQEKWSFNDTMCPLSAVEQRRLVLLLMKDKVCHESSISLVSLLYRVIQNIMRGLRRLSLAALACLLAGKRAIILTLLPNTHSVIPVHFPSRWSRGGVSVYWLWLLLYVSTISVVIVIIAIYDMPRQEFSLCERVYIHYTYM